MPHMCNTISFTLNQAHSKHICIVIKIKLLYMYIVIKIKLLYMYIVIKIKLLRVKGQLNGGQAMAWLAWPVATGL